MCDGFGLSPAESRFLFVVHGQQLDAQAFGGVGGTPGIVAAGVTVQENANVMSKFLRDEIPQPQKYSRSRATQKFPNQ